MTEGPTETPEQYEARLRRMLYETRAEQFARDVEMAQAPWLDPRKGNRKSRRQLRKAYRKVRNASQDDND